MPGQGRLEAAELLFVDAVPPVGVVSGAPHAAGLEHGRWVVGREEEQVGSDLVVQRGVEYPAMHRLAFGESSVVNGLRVGVGGEVDQERERVRIGKNHRVEAAGIHRAKHLLPDALVEEPDVVAVCVRFVECALVAAGYGIPGPESFEHALSFVVSYQLATVCQRRRFQADN